MTPKRSDKYDESEYAMFKRMQWSAFQLVTAEMLLLFFMVSLFSTLSLCIFSILIYFGMVEFPDWNIRIFVSSIFMNTSLYIAYKAVLTNGIKNLKPSENENDPNGC